MNLFVSAGLSNILSLLEQSYKFIILGIVQGLSEFIPISSTAHLKIIPLLLGWEDPGISVTAFLQLGSIIAVIAYFRNDFSLLLRGVSKLSFRNSFINTNTRLLLSIVLGSLPIIFAGMFIKLYWLGYESSFLRSVPFIAVISIIMAFFLLIAEIYGSRKKTIEDLSILDGVVIGFSQVLSLIPGASRSGVTITAALMQGWERESAARFSFILGMPAIILAGIVELKDAFASNESFSAIPLLLGLISSALTSWLAIDFLIKFLQKNSMMIFVTYRFLFGLLLLFWYY